MPDGQSDYTFNSWQWQNDKKQWVDFAPEHSEQLNSALSQNKDGEVVKHHWVNKKGKPCTTNYTVSFKTYRQTNMDSWTERPVRCNQVKAMGPTQVQGACDGWGYDEANDWVDDDGRGWHGAKDGEDEANNRDEDKEKTSKDANDRDAANDRDEDKEKTSTDAKDAADAANEASQNQLQKASKDIMKLLQPGSHAMASNQDIEKDSNEVDPSNEGVAAKGGFESLD